MTVTYPGGPIGDEEQDRAAGGRTRRLLELPGGRRVLGEVQLRTGPSGRQEAYLLWSGAGGSGQQRLGEVERANRADALRAAWNYVHASGL